MLLNNRVFAFLVLGILEESFHPNHSTLDLCVVLSESDSKLHTNFVL